MTDTHPNYTEYNHKCQRVNAKRTGNFAVDLGVWHCWQGSGAILLSNENTKHIRSFPDTDAAINWLFVSGHKPAARQLHETANWFFGKVQS